MRTLVQSRKSEIRFSHQELAESELEKVAGGVTFEYGHLEVAYTRQEDTGAAQGIVATSVGKH